MQHSVLGVELVNNLFAAKVYVLSFLPDLLARYQGCDNTINKNRFNLFNVTCLFINKFPV